MNSEQLLNASAGQLSNLMTQNNIDHGNSGVSGFYIGVNASISAVGIEGVAFVGLDANGNKVTAYYTGLTLAADEGTLAGFDADVGVGADLRP